MTFHNRNLLNSASRGIDGDAQLGEFISSLTKQFEDFRGTLGSRLQHAEDEIEAMTERYARERIYGDGPAPDRASSDEAIAAFLSASQRKPVSMAEVDEDYRASLREYAPAFAAWLRRGDALPMQVKGALPSWLRSRWRIFCRSRNGPRYLNSDSRNIADARDRKGAVDKQ